MRTFLLVGFLAISFSRIIPGSVAIAQVTKTEKPAEQTESVTDEAKYPSEIISFPLFDGETLTGKLYLPNQEKIRCVVIFVHGTGPGTYLNRRKAGRVVFNYFDLLAEPFNEKGIAFFSHNKRGVEMAETPPTYETVDREKFKKVVPGVEAKDLATMVDFFGKDERLKDAKIILFGWSEGSVLASLVAEQRPNDIDAIFLAGYAHENMWDIIKWQFSGHASMLAINPVFDTNGSGDISQEEYESEEDRQTRYRNSAMKRTPFKALDANSNSKIEAIDFGMRIDPIYQNLLRKIEAEDDDWIWKNYFRISSAWLREHFALEANKTRLLRLDLPIFVFHGTEDPDVSVEGVYDLEKRFAALGKTNLKTFVFEGHEHNLNFLDWPMKYEISEGIQKIYEVADDFQQKE